MCERDAEGTYDLNSGCYLSHKNVRDAGRADGADEYEL